MKTRYDTLDINNKLIWNLRDIGHTMRRVREGRGSQQRVLILLRESGPTTQRELTARIGVQPGSASEAIAHRLSTIRDADLIVVMDQGRIVEQGRHDALLAKKGKCYDLYMTQLAGLAT